MKLADLVQQIVNAAPEGWLSAQELYASLDFRGPRNAHLAIPDWHTEDFRTLDMKRHEFLTGDEEIAGDVLVFDFFSRDGTMLLHECASLTEAAGYVLGPGGVFNHFTDFVIVLEHGRLRPYRATYRDHTGKRVAFDGAHIKNDEPFPDRQIEWLELVPAQRIPIESGSSTPSASA